MHFDLFNRTAPHKVVPWSIRKTLNWLKRSYGNVSMYVAGNSVYEADADDINTPVHFRDYLDEVLKGQ